jgi:hypothetical protein
MYWRHFPKLNKNNKRNVSWNYLNFRICCTLGSISCDGNSANLHSAYKICELLLFPYTFQLWSESVSQNLLIVAALVVPACHELSQNSDVLSPGAR